MPNHKEIKNLNYSAKQILDLILDIEKYPDFLPWCIGAKVTKIIDESGFKDVGADQEKVNFPREFEGDLAISFKGFFQKYSSNIVWKEIEDNGFEVRVIAIDGPFKNLINLWHVKPINDSQSYVDFFIDFEFKSVLLNKMISPVFAKATDKMIQAFEKRADEIYTK